MEGDAQEEKIVVVVRLRPLSEKEALANEASDWECINDTTVLYRNTLREGSTYPSAYTFDRVFRGDCPTRLVYSGGVREVALSVVRGVNSCVFAYGQTSSGKTYTMMGVTECAVSEMFDYMSKHGERAFVLKFSAMEIYNEAIRDLLSEDASPLRLLDDHERGTVVERIKEETLKDQNHFQELLSVCEAQRRIGETSLNEKSSRSHQILRLTVESSAREFLDKENFATLSATVNFVDLAGSERASQAMASGARLKEGCHINRSLLTLGTVIRKLSKGRPGHINYRDSKLTRLLQPALGGNARTAIICTISPARSHVEQTRNTLLFACCAKEVTTKSQVNVVMSDKALVKHLQREVARLESELRSPAAAPSSSNNELAAILRKREIQIQKMEKDIQELTMQRDLAESRVQDLLRIIGHDQTSASLGWEEDGSVSESYLNNADGSSTPLNFPVRYHQFTEETNSYCKEVQCIEMDTQCDSTPASILLEEEILASIVADSEVADNSVNRETQSGNGVVYHSMNYEDGDTNGNSETQRGNSEALSDNGVPSLIALNGAEIPASESSAIDSSNARTWSCRQTLFNGDESERLSGCFSKSSLGSVRIPAGDDFPSVQTFVTELQTMANQEHDKQIYTKDVALSPMAGKQECSIFEFETIQKAIIELWHKCHVSLIHRTYFFLLFKGDSSDSIYLQVEHRRLSFLQETPLHLSSSVKALSQERTMLSKLMRKRLSEEERMRIYDQWGIDKNSKRRRLQLAKRLWSSTDDREHIVESASVVAKIIKFMEQGKTTQGMFGLCFAPTMASSRRRSSTWSYSRATSA